MARFAAMRLILGCEPWSSPSPKVLAAVKEGLEQARAGHLSDGPDLDAALAEIAKRDLADFEASGEKSIPWETTKKELDLDA